MTNKERLEDIDVVHYEEDEDGNNFVLLKEDDYWFLKEQSERVQELDRKGINLASRYIKANERNRRYREAMVEAREASSCCGLTAGAILDEALEGQE